MEVFNGIEGIKHPFKNPVLTIGNFDGVHRGHRALFEKVKHWADELEGESLVVTFDPHPLKVLRPGNGPDLITIHERKLELIGDCGIDAVLVIPFTKEFALISAEEFVTGILVGRIGVKGIVVGYDYRFGNGREGDIDYLKGIGAEKGFRVEVVSGINIDDTVVSSTIIRKLIREGEIVEANHLLGRPYEVSGIVVPGRQRGGKLIGFPTANVGMAGQAPPKQGVYAVEAVVENRPCKGAANLGFNPTFGDTDLSLEVHIFDFSDNIYGKPITVRFIERLRDEIKFAGVEELTTQIRKDVEEAKKILGYRTE